jgi:O-antigen/teichoic acid export membrane protein
MINKNTPPRLNAMSVRHRALISILTNTIRVALGFITGMLLARELSPQGYGELTFLIGTFVAARALMDAGISNAFFTFISQQSQSLKLYLFYCASQLIQFATLFLFVKLIIPDDILHLIWVNIDDRNQILLALCATFMQQSVWQAIIQVGEAARKTLLVQSANVVIAIASLGIVLWLSAINKMSILFVLAATFFLYLTASIVIGSYLKTVTPISPRITSIRLIASEFWRYCKPMLILSIVSGIYLFADKWLLQNFGGPIQQAFFQVASQCSLLTLLVTTSVLSIFWKEIAEAHTAENHSRVAMLYKYATRTLVTLSTAMAGVIIPWSEEIVLHFLGTDYKQSWIVVAVMLLCPIFQSLSQINGVYLMAVSNTKLYTAIGLFGMLITLPLSYLAVAPSIAVVPGLEMGALGFALKEVFTTIVVVAVQSFFIARSQGWRIDLDFTLATIGALVIFGYLVKLIISGAMKYFDIELSISSLIFAVSLSSLFVLVALIFIGWYRRKALAPFYGNVPLLKLFS